MIKNFKNKFLICLFLLVTVFSVTSSCFALTNTYATDTITLEDVETFISNKYGSQYLFENGGIFVAGSVNGIRFIYYYDSTDVAYLKIQATGSYYQAYPYNSKGENINVNVNNMQLKVAYGSNSLEYFTGSVSQIDSKNSIGNWIKDYVIYSSCTNTILNTDGTVLHEVEASINTSFNYSFEGIKRGQTKLSIDNLDSSLRIYGYVGLNTTFDIGDTLSCPRGKVKCFSLSNKKFF